MDARKARAANRLRTTVVRACLFALLVAVCLGLVLGATKLLRSGEPLVDLAERSGAVVPSRDAQEEEPRLRFAVATIVSAEETFATYRRLVQRISRDVGLREAFIVPPSYTDVRLALEQKRVDVAFVCTGTYARTSRDERIKLIKRVKLLVQPEFEEGLDYRCLLIVPAASRDREISDLQGRVMAFTDPESNTGCFVPSAVLVNRGYDPKTYFKKVIFTGSHDRSILSVAQGLVDVAAVDSLVWESNLRQDPSLAQKVRTMWSSDPFGPPAIVVPVGLDSELEESLREAFLALHEDDEGRQILKVMGITRFVPGRPEDYTSAIKLYEDLEENGGVTWP